MAIAAAFLPMIAASQTTIPAQRVSDIATGGGTLNINANPANFTLIDTRLFFTASDKHNHRGVYMKNLVSSDGVTVAPTVWTGKGNTPKLLMNFKLPVGVNDLDQFVGTEQASFPGTGKVYFHVPGGGLWMTYGKTPVVLGRFDNLNLGDEVSDITGVQADSDAILPLVYLSGWSKKTGQELYRSEGTAKTTKLVQDIAPGAASSNPDSIVELKQGDASTVFFRANNGQSAYPEIWETQTGDLTNAALVLTSTLGAPTQLVTSEDIGGCYFVMPTATSNGVPELWYTTGTPGSETPFTAGGVGPENLTEFPGNGDSVIFSGSDNVNGRQIWEANSFIGGGELLNVINANGDANPYDLTAAASEFYFGAAVTDTNSEETFNFLWVTDGNSSDTSIVSNTTDSNTYYPTNPSQITPVLDDQGNGMVYFTADGTVDNGAGAVFMTNVLWMVPNDGVSQATPVLDANNQVVTGAYNLRAVVNSAFFFRLYFARNGGNGFGSEVWVTEN